MDKSVFTLVFGFLLGVKHAFETDHIIAVSNILAEQKSSLKAALVGTFWGIGHTTTIFVIGVFVLLLRISITAEISNLLEFGVGIMLVFIGIQNIVQGRVMFHTHPHTHEGKSHTHAHPHVREKTLHAHHKSFIIGIIHGLAGSGALMLLVLSTISSPLQGMYYIAVFGIGSILGMTISSFILGTPFVYGVNKFPNIEKYIRITAGTVSLLFGIFLLINRIYFS
ncbi:MAG: sulfite exporter TauE/SafE family protein [Candidatus Levybacteria bacterium]|nr:sulfite exporter TauE/SafE family protein [Candidatus Levybacteria bacterium]